MFKDGYELKWQGPTPWYLQESITILTSELVAKIEKEKARLMIIKMTYRK